MENETKLIADLQVHRMKDKDNIQSHISGII